MAAFLSRAERQPGLYVLGRAALFASRAPFFAFCVLLVLLWLLQGLITILVKGDPKSFLDAQFQLEINTTTTIVTFLMVALLQNSQTREDQATQHKLNAIADGLADMMERWSERFDDAEMRKDIEELRLAVGLEDVESTTDNDKRGTSDKPNGQVSQVQNQVGQVQAQAGEISKTATEALERANETLERRVRERTEELTRLNAELAHAKGAAARCKACRSRQGHCALRASFKPRRIGSGCAGIVVTAALRARMVAGAGHRTARCGPGPLPPPRSVSASGFRS